MDKHLIKLDDLRCDAFKTGIIVVKFEYLEELVTDLANHLEKHEELKERLQDIKDMVEDYGND